MIKRINHTTKQFNLFRRICLLNRIRKNNKNYEEIIKNIQINLKEKIEIISKNENEFNLTNSEIVNLSKINQNLTEENDSLRRKIATLESKLDSDNMRFRELWNQNVNDIKCKIRFKIFFLDLQETLQKNESLLSEAIKREEKLQHKYCLDIENSIKMNKQLNSIISKKNKVLADLKVKQFKNDEEKIIEHKKLYKENASLFNDYAKIIEIKEKEKRHLEEDKLRIKEITKNKLEELRENQIKSDFKVKILENENHQIFNEMINKK